MIYAKVHSGDGGITFGIASRIDKPDNTWTGFNVQSHDWLFLDVNNNISVHTQVEMDAILAARTVSILKDQASLSLEHTDLVASRCFKSGVTFPANWQSYTLALRNIVNGTDTTSTALPAQPAYPAGT